MIPLPALAALVARAVAPAGPCDRPAPSWIFCDDFERDRRASYFEVVARGSFTRAAGVGRGGSWGMRARWSAGQVDAGALHLAFGRTPHRYFRPADAGTAVYREVYWRVWLWRAPGWTGGGGHKLARVTSFADSTWAQAMAAHLWSGVRARRDMLVLVAASGTDTTGRLRTGRYNDVSNFRWLGARAGTTPVFADSTAGRWVCIEAHVRLETPGRADGVFEPWVDGRPEARRDGLAWVGGSAAYGINALFLENYWNGGAPGPRERVFDDLVVATAPIGCAP
jgi:hypothetical protein